MTPERGPRKGARSARTRMSTLPVWAPALALSLALTLLGPALLPGWVTAAQWGVPTARSAAVQPLAAVERLEAPIVDIVAVQAEDAARERAGEPPRYAIANAVDITPETGGTWEILADGTLLWRLRIESPGALSLNLGFKQYRMPPGARLCLYPSGDDSRSLAFDARDNKAHGQLWTPVVLAAEIVVEMTLPAPSRHDYLLDLTSVNVGYRFFGEPPAAKSGVCNVDVVCPVADPWRLEIPAVGVLSVSGMLTCSGFLVNNTAKDQRPFFMTANHCGVVLANAATVVVYWNFQSPVCGERGGGSMAEFQSGSTFRAGNALSDFTLVELDDPVNPAFKPSYAGWERGPADPASGVVIHHPSVDEKSISFDNHPLETTSYYGTVVPGDGTHLRVIAYDLGSTEPGSSGSPLFDQNHHAVGQLHGGDAACGNNLSDYYGRLYLSWTGGGTPDTRLSDWLDPLGTGAMNLDTLAPWAPIGETVQLGPEPNPIDPNDAQTGIVFDQTVAGVARLAIYDVRGRLVRELQADRSPGRNSLHWDGRDGAGRAAASGVYLYRLEVGGQEFSGKLALVR